MIATRADLPRGEDLVSGPVAKDAARQPRVVGKRAELVENLLLRTRTDVDRVRRLCRLIARLAREAWSALGIKLIACIGTRLAGTGAQLASILLLTAYLDRVLDDAVIGLPVVGELTARADRVIYAAGAIIVGLFALSGVLNYLYGRWSWRLAGAFELHLIRRAAYALGTVPPWRKEIDGVPVTPSTIRKVIGSDPRRAQFALRHLLQGAVEPVAIAVWVGAMAWLNPSLTALIVPVALIALPFVLRVNRRASGMTRHLEQTQAFSAPERQLIDHRLRHRLIDPAQDDPWVEQFLSRGHLAANVEAFSTRQIVMEESRVVFTLAFSCLLLLVVWVGGGAALYGGMTWGALVAFLLITRALLGQAVALGGTITHSSRLYPILSRYFALVDAGSAAAGEAGAKAVAATPAVVTVRARSLDGDPASIELRAGDRIGIMTRQTADSQLMPTLCATIAKRDEDVLRAFFGRLACVSGTARGAGRSGSAGLPTLDDQLADDVARRLTEAGLSDVAALLRRLDRDRPSESAQAEPPAYFAPAVLLARAGVLDVPTVIVDTTAVLKIPQAPRRHLLARLGARLVLLVYSLELPPGRLFAFDEKALLVDLADGPEPVYLVRSSQWPGSKARLRSLLRGRTGRADSPGRDEVDVELEEHDV